MAGIGERHEPGDSHARDAHTELLEGREEQVVRERPLVPRPGNCALNRGSRVRADPDWQRRARVVHEIDEVLFLVETDGLDNAANHGPIVPLVVIVAVGAAATRGQRKSPQREQEEDPRRLP